MADFPFRTSYWFPDQTALSDAPLSKQVEADVVIIGGGFAGLSAAYHLKKTVPQISVVLLESHHLGFGASGRNGGWLVPFPPLYWLVEDLKNPQINSDCQFAVHQNQKFIHDLGNQFGRGLNYDDWKPTTHYLAARNAFERAILQWFKTRLDMVGVATDYFETPSKDQPLGYSTKAILTWQMVAIQPYKFLLKIAQNCRCRGVQIFEKTPVQKITSHSDHFQIQVAQTFSVRAKKVILSTNAYSAQIDLDVRLPKGSIQHTYMLATAPLQDEILQKISRDLHPFGDPSLFYYCGRFHEGRLLFNGGDRISRALPQDDRHVSSYIKLVQEIQKRFPFLSHVKIESAWGGPVFQTASDAPIIACARENPNFIFNIGFGGSSGICWALQSGRLTTDLVLGEKSTDSDAARLRKILQSSSIPTLGPARAVVGVLKKMATSLY